MVTLPTHGRMANPFSAVAKKQSLFLFLWFNPFCVVTMAKQLLQKLGVGFWLWVWLWIWIWLLAFGFWLLAAWSYSSVDLGAMIDWLALAFELLCFFLSLFSLCFLSISEAGPAWALLCSLFRSGSEPQPQQEQGGGKKESKQANEEKAARMNIYALGECCAWFYPPAQRGEGTSFDLEADLDGRGF